MPNIKAINNSHNHKITNLKTITKERTCNCIDEAKCPLNQNCLINNIIYKAVLPTTSPCCDTHTHSEMLKPPMIN